MLHDDRADYTMSVRASVCC